MDLAVWARFGALWELNAHRDQDSTSGWLGGSQPSGSLAVWLLGV